MMNLSKALITEETNQRLNEHGLTLSVKKAKSDINTEGYIEEVGQYHTFFGLPAKLYPAADNETIKDYMESVLEDFYDDVVEHMSRGAIWYPIYDLGLTEHNYTIKESKATNWLTLCGLVIADAAEIFDEFNIQEDATKLDDKTEDIVVDRIERHLAVLAADHNDEVYEIEVRTNSDDSNGVKRIKKHAHNTGDGIDKDVNVLISRVTADINKYGVKIELEIDQQIIDMNVSPAAYINKRLSVLLGFKMAFGSIDFDKERKVLKTYIRRSTLPPLSMIKSATGENIYNGIYEHIVNLKNIDEADAEAKLSVLSQVTSTGFNFEYSHENLLGTYLGLFDYVDGIDIKEIEVEAMPF